MRADTFAGQDGPSSESRLMGLLRHAAIFQDLSLEELAGIASGTTELRCERGRALFRRGDPCIGLHLVVYGQIKLVVSTAAGDERVVDIIGPGMTFGEALMFTDRPYVVSASTVVDSFVLHVDKQKIYAELERDPRLARRMLAGLSCRLHMLVRDVEALTLHSATQRLIGYLTMLEEATTSGCITLPAQKSLVASRLNLTPEYFSRILHALEGAGIIHIDGRDIRILDAPRLRTYGSDAPGN